MNAELAGRLLRGGLETSLRVSMLTMAVAMMLVALRVRASHVRHAAWTGVLCAMLAMPILPSLLPAIAIPASVIPAVPVPAAFNLDIERVAPRALDATRVTPRVAGSAPAMAGSRADAAGFTPARSSTEPSRDQHQHQEPIWPAALIGIYVAGVSIGFAHLLLGWRAAHRLARASRRIVLPDADSCCPVPVGESRVVATPVTLGIFRPVILLPMSWRGWPDETRRAVVAHEVAHVDRRDPLVGWLAHINCCLFWFHPVAWWLKRALAAAAEHASDDRAVRSIGEARRYAEILLDMARAAKARGGRLSWQGIGIDGSGLLGARIDRILNGRVDDVSVFRKTAVAACCITAIVLAAACRQQASSPPGPPGELTPSQQARENRLRAELEQTSREEYRNVGVKIPGAQDLARLEALANRDPADLEALEHLLTGYWLRLGADGDTQMLMAARRSRILWLIEHHPESALSGSPEARLVPADLDPRSFRGDPVGYARARELWISHVDRPDVGSTILGNAARFFESSDRPLTEQLLLRAHAQDPDGPWMARLGRFYAVVLTGAYARAGNQLRLISAAAPRGYGAVVRRKLGESADETLLTAAGWFLARGPRGLRGPEMYGDVLQSDAWAQSCFTRVLQLNPRAVLAHTELLDISERRNREEPLWRVPLDEEYEQISALPEVERFDRLPDLALNAYDRVVVKSKWNDPNLRDSIELERTHARKYAEDALALAPRHRDHRRYGTAIFAANLTLGSLALEAGDTRKAISFLRNASRAPASEELIYKNGMAWGMHARLPRDLVKQGEREAVADFLDRMAAVSLADRATLRATAAALRRGDTPPLRGL